MATNNRIQVTELDFDDIKNNIINYLKGQSQFTDYNFEGSNLSILLDVLAYNTHYNGIYTNLAVNEMFLDSASKRSSLVSLAKTLGYTPRSATCAKAIVNATVISPSASPLPTVVTIPAGQPFTTKVDNVTYTFYNQDSVTTTLSTSGTYVFNNLNLVEGTPLQYRYTVAPGIRFIIPNANVDISTITVKVQETSSSYSYDNYILADSIVNTTPESKLFWVKEIDNGLYELTFGDDNIGKALVAGNVVTINYYVSSLEAPNGVSTFTYSGQTILGSNLSVSTVTPAYGGGSSESLDSIRFNAPRQYAAQNRCVTTDDYKTMILAKFPQAQTVQVWGGEDGNSISNDLIYSNPNIVTNGGAQPQYGKVYICVKPKGAPKLTQQEKDTITAQILKTKNIVSVSPQIVDPEYFNVRVTTYVHYNPRLTSKTPSQLQSLVSSAIMDYNDTQLSSFDSVLRYSKLCAVIDGADPSITNNITTLTISHPHEVKYNISAQYVVNLVNPISKEINRTTPSFYSSGFYIPSSSLLHYLEDDGAGNVALYYLDSNLNKIYVNKTIGTIDYSKGQIIVKTLNITAIDGAEFQWLIKPESYDVTSALNQLVEIDPNYLSVNIIADNSSNGDTQAGYNYTFNSIRS